MELSDTQSIFLQFGELPEPYIRIDSPLMASQQSINISKLQTAVETARMVMVNPDEYTKAVKEAEAINYVMEQSGVDTKVYRTLEEIQEIREVEGQIAQQALAQQQEPEPEGGAPPAAPPA